MTVAWILQTSEIRRPFSRATSIPLRASLNDERGSVKEVGCRGHLRLRLRRLSKQHHEAAERLSWTNQAHGGLFFWYRKPAPID